MHKLNNLKDIKGFRQRILCEKALVESKPTLVICAGTGGQASGSNDIMRIIKRQILERNLQGRISLRVTGCQGFCEMDPFILVEPGHNLYPRLKMEDVPRVIDAALTGQILDDLLYCEPGTTRSYKVQEDIPFFKKQHRIILGNNEKIDPIRLYDYVENDGYAALEKVFENLDPEWIIEEVKKSGIRGRGGAGFPTGIKWERARRIKPNYTPKFIVCNADEGDPGAYMDRSLLEGNPHAIIEGMIIAGIAIGATQGIIYVRTEYPLAIKHSSMAIHQARDLGLLGKKIVGTGIDFDIMIVRGAGAFVCGEETALIKSIEGKIGEPRQRPPYPIEKGINGHPTCINNVETLANIPYIIKHGGDEYAKIGVPGNSGTKIFSLVGKVRNTGLVEVPLGIKIKEVVYDIGGGSLGKAKIKAVQTGGPSGGCIPASLFDLPIDYDSLVKAGSIMGSGGMIVMDENTCMVDIAKYYMKFLKEESCGKCFTCRKGTQRMWELLDDISRGNATLDKINLLKDLAQVVQDTTMCGLGQTASNPVLSTLKYFADEYIEHIMDRKCRAGVCKDLVGAPCQSTCPIGTEAWRYVAHIARGEYEQAYMAIRETNPFPSICARVCDHKCEDHCKLGQTGNRSVAIRMLKRYVTDNVDPSAYKPAKLGKKKTKRVAVVGAGPAGLTAAHYLSLMGYPVTVFEADSKPGGMMYSCIPEYRLPRDILDKEVAAILNGNVSIKCNQVFGKDVTIESLFKDGYKAVFLGLGAQKGRRLYLDGEDCKGVYPSIEFLKAYTQGGQNLAKGRVAVVGGGNSAIDAARTALRQPGVKSATILYRRTRDEMPAFAEEIEAAIEEGIKLETLVIPNRILRENGTLVGIQCQRAELGEVDYSGRRKPVAIAGNEFMLPLDTLIVAISEQPEISSYLPTGEPELKIHEDGTLEINKDTLLTSHEGVFAGGDVVTGPNTVVDAIAAGKKAAVMIDRYLRGEELRQQEAPRIPKLYIKPLSVSEEELEQMRRAEPPRVPAELRRRTFEEVEKAMSEADARREALRCLRCDLEFTQPKPEALVIPVQVEEPLREEKLA